MKVSRAIFAGAALIAVCALTGGLIYLPELRSPDRAGMRAYRLSQMTDAHLREMHDRAAAIAQQRRDADEDQRKKSIRDAAENAEACRLRQADPAFHARNPAPCGFEVFSDPFPPETTESVFEEMISGRCIFAHSLYEARAFGCLPPRWSFLR